MCESGLSTRSIGSGVDPRPPLHRWVCPFHWSSCCQRASSQPLLRTGHCWVGSSANPTSVQVPAAGKCAPVAVPQAARLSGDPGLASWLGGWGLVVRQGQHCRLDGFQAAGQFGVRVSDKGAILGCVGRTEAKIATVRCLGSTSKTQGVKGWVNAGPLAVFRNRCLSAEGRIISNPCHSYKVLAHPNNAYKVCHQLRDGFRVFGRQYPYVRRVALYPSEYIRHLPGAPRGEPTLLRGFVPRGCPKFGQQLRHFHVFPFANFFGQFCRYWGEPFPHVDPPSRWDWVRSC